MFKHALVQAESVCELSKILGLSVDSIQVVRRKPFETRLAATEFLQLKFPLLRSYRAIAAPVLLPTTSKYTRAVAELNALGERLRLLPVGWSSSKDRTEKKIVEHAAKLNYMELTQDQPKELSWVVYLAAEQDYERHVGNRPALQQAS